MEFICSGCPNSCRLSYKMRDGALIAGEGKLCPKGMLALIKVHLPINQRRKEATVEQAKRD